MTTVMPVVLPAPGNMTQQDVFTQEQVQREQQPTYVNEYWANKTGKEVIAELERKRTRYFDFMDHRGFTSMSRIMLAQWLGLDPDDVSEWATQTVHLDGERGELLRFRVNETRSFTKQLVTMAVGQRPSFECEATNTDYDSMGQAETADAVIDYSYHRYYGERKELRTFTNGCLLGLSSARVHWDPQGGDDLPPVDEPVMMQLPDGSMAPRLDPATGAPVTRKVPSGKKTGCLHAQSINWWDQYFDPTVEDQDDHLWWVYRERRSKHEVCAAYPQYASEIMGGEASKRDRYSVHEIFGFDRMASLASDDDHVIVEHFYHVKSPALDQAKYKTGRYIQACNGCALLDGPLPFSRLPWVPFMPAEYIGTALGYSDVWDLCSINQMIDEVVSMVASNVTAFGRQSVWIQEGTDYSPSQIANGMNVFKGSVGSEPPQAVQLAAMPDGAKWILEFLIARMQSLSGLNSVSRGDPSGNVTSGTMAALFHSIAIEINSALQLAVDRHRQDVANLMLDILKQYAEYPLIQQIAGSDERHYADTFTRDNLYGIRGVTVKTSNPMLRTQAGRVEVAKMMLQMGAVSTPDALLEVLVSGQVKPMYNAPRKSRLRIKLENETLMQAPPVRQVQPPPMPPLPNGMQMPPPPPYPVVEGVPVHLLDPHDLHIPEHYSLLTSREALRNKAFADAVNAHIQDHIRQWKQSDPALMMALGRRPWPGPAVMGMLGAGAAPAPEGEQPPPPENDNGAPPVKPRPSPSPSQGERDALGPKLPAPAESPVANQTAA